MLYDHKSYIYDNVHIIVQCWDLQVKRHCDP